MRPLLAALLFSGCGLRNAVLIESAKPARVIDARTGELLCARTPCRIEQERLWPIDSSLHYKLLRAVSESGVSQDLAIDTHKVKDGQTIRFEFRPTER